MVSHWLPALNYPTHRVVSANTFNLAKHERVEASTSQTTILLDERPDAIERGEVAYTGDIVFETRRRALQPGRTRESRHQCQICDLLLVTATGGSTYTSHNFETEMLWAIAATTGGKWYMLFLCAVERLMKRGETFQRHTRAGCDA